MFKFENKIYEKAVPVAPRELICLAPVLVNVRLLQPGERLGLCSLNLRQVDLESVFGVSAEFPGLQLVN